MSAATGRRIVREEGGFTLIELLITMMLMGFVIAGIVNVFASGTRAQYVMNSQMDAQQSARLALSRLEYEGRCASAATIVNSGAGVAFSLPSVCSHASGTVSWCVVSGALERFSSGSCSGSGTPFVRDLTSTAPFALHTASGDLPQLLVNLVANPTGNVAGGFAISDLITLRNSSPS